MGQAPCSCDRGPQVQTQTIQALGEDGTGDAGDAPADTLDAADAGAGALAGPEAVTVAQDDYPTASQDKGTGELKEAKHEGKDSGEKTADKYEEIGSLNTSEGKYNGQVAGGKRHGKGTLTYTGAQAGAVYTGEWVNDLREGLGKLELADKSTYDGEFKAGLKHGKGRFLFASKNTYEGQYHQDNMHGQGSYTWTDGRIYTGQWNRGVMGPKGVMTWSDGRLYEGVFDNGHKHGEGTMKWPDGRSYAGQWLNGKQHGEGIATSAKGDRRKCEWSDGKFVKWIGGKLPD
eukprot:TRINITY_DN7898_c0_g1_i2.p1 TRINITY_DN7898_c0_g1~~TRINITY_DN7898_c0_g1_i2.p1  ORF type:complete len:296 (+),score=70.52 TRINITY_DN7898_c0_g1_i2:26-889(+)